MFGFATRPVERRVWARLGIRDPSTEGAVGDMLVLESFA
jgi:hypothetical protein